MAGGVAFQSSASNLVTGDTNNTSDVFVKDLEDGLFRRVSQRHDPIDVIAQGNGISTAAAISGDGRYVAFRSAATNLVDDDTNGVIDVFTRFSTVPRVNSLSPIAAAQGSTLNLLMGGNGFLSSPSPTVSLGEGVAVNSVTRLNAAVLRVNITVAGERRGPAAGTSSSPTLAPDQGSGQGAADFCEGCFSVTAP